MKKGITCRKVAWYFLTAIYLITIGCGTVASVRPVGKDDSALVFSIGGPVTPIYDINIPAPYTVLRYRRGWNETTDFHIGIHPTMAAFGNLALDAGATKHFLKQSQWIPALAIEGSIYGFYHVGETSSLRIYPEFSLTGSYRLSERNHLFYLGTHAMVQYVDPYVIFVPYIGFEIPFGNQLVLNLETKWYAPHEDSENRIVDYAIKPWNYGALGFTCGLSVNIGKGAQ